jgi:hypothetical protein
VLVGRLWGIGIYPSFTAPASPGWGVPFLLLLLGTPLGALLALGSAAPHASGLRGPAAFCVNRAAEELTNSHRQWAAEKLISARARGCQSGA